MSPNSDAIPLVVDLDGTLIATDTFYESVIQLVKSSPATLLKFPVWLFHGRARLKQEVASRTEIDPAHLPYRESFLPYLRDEKAKGRRLILATAAHRSIATSVADHIGLFDQVLATEGSSNLKGDRKLDAIRDAIGSKFVYAGDSRADLPIWRGAQGAVLVNASKGVARALRTGSIGVEREFISSPQGVGIWLRALRIHQWVKNLLLFVPMLTAFSFLEPRNAALLALAFMAFSLAASATYIVNDLWDLPHDRLHPRKRRRPLASGTIGIPDALMVSGASLVTALVLALAVSLKFVAVLLVYLLLTSAYSWFLKRRVLADVLTLALLYTIRIIAGAVAIGVSVSDWLLAFSVFAFLGLGVVKRCAELVSLAKLGRDSTSGRGYRVDDLVILWPLGVAASVSSIVVFGIFANAPETLARYNSPQLLWISALALFYWFSYLWLKTARGEMHDDPVVFAARNRTSRVALFVVVVAMITAHFFPQGGMW